MDSLEVSELFEEVEILYGKSLQPKSTATHLTSFIDDIYHFYPKNDCFCTQFIDKWSSLWFLYVRSHAWLFFFAFRSHWTHIMNWQRFLFILLYSLLIVSLICLQYAYGFVTAHYFTCEYNVSGGELLNVLWVLSAVEVIAYAPVLLVIWLFTRSECCAGRGVFDSKSVRIEQKLQIQSLVLNSKKKNDENINEEKEDENEDESSVEKSINVDVFSEEMQFKKQVLKNSERITSGIQMSEYSNNQPKFYDDSHQIYRNPNPNAYGLPVCFFYSYISLF